MRNMQKALLSALLTPSEELKAAQDASDFTKVLALTEEVKTMPYSIVWDEYCSRLGIPTGMDWYSDVLDYEKNVQSKRA